MRASLQHDGKGPRCGTKALCRAFSARPCGKFRSTSMALPPLSQIFRPKTQARKRPVQTGQNALPGPRAVSLRGRASAMHAGFRGKRPTKPFPETQRCPFPGQPAETSMTKHPEGTGTGHRFLAPGCAQAEARPPRRERHGHTPERMFSRKRPCVLCEKIPSCRTTGKTPPRRRSARKNTGGELRPLSVPGRRSHRGDAQAQNTAGLCDGAGDRLRPAGKKTEAWREVSPNSAGVWRFACSGRLLMRRKSVPEGRILPCLCSAPKAFPASEKHIGKERPRKNSLIVDRAEAAARPSLSETFTSPLNTSPGRKETGAKKSSLGYGAGKEAPGKTAKGVLPRPHGTGTLSCGRPPRAFRRRLCKGRKLPHGIPAGVPPEKHGRGASAAIRAGKAFAPQGCAGAKAESPASFLRA